MTRLNPHKLQQTKLTHLSYPTITDNGVVADPGKPLARFRRHFLCRVLKKQSCLALYTITMPYMVTLTYKVL